MVLIAATRRYAQAHTHAHQHSRAVVYTHRPEISSIIDTLAEMESELKATQEKSQMLGFTSLQRERVLDELELPEEVGTHTPAQQDAHSTTQLDTARTYLAVLICFVLHAM